MKKVCVSFQIYCYAYIFSSLSSAYIVVSVRFVQLYVFCLGIQDFLNYLAVGKTFFSIFSSTLSFIKSILFDAFIRVVAALPFNNLNASLTDNLISYLLTGPSCETYCFCFDTMRPSFITTPYKSS